MLGLCCFAQSGAASNEPPKTKPPNLLEEPAENLEAFKEGLRSISTPASSFQKVAPDLIDLGLTAITSSGHVITSQSTRKLAKSAKSVGHVDGHISSRVDMEVFERRQFEAYKEEVEKRRRLQLIERQMALFNTWEFYNEQEMWDLLVRYNQYIQSGHQIFLTPMADCPIHGHSITTKHQQQQQTKRGHKPHNKKLKQRRRPSVCSLSDDQSSPYASQYSDNQRGSDRSRSSLTSQVSAEIHSVEKSSSSMQSVLKIIAGNDPPLPSDASEKDSGIDKNSINSSFGNGSDRASRKSLEQPTTTTTTTQQLSLAEQLERVDHDALARASPMVPHKSPRASPRPRAAGHGHVVENDYELDVPVAKVDEDGDDEDEDGGKNGSAEYRDYREGIYYARDEVKPEPEFGAIWNNCSSPTANTYEDMELGRRESLCGGGAGGGGRRPRQRDESDEFAPLSDPQTDIVYGNQDLDDDDRDETHESEQAKSNDATSEESVLNSIEKYYVDDKAQTLDIDCRDLLECKGDQCSPSKVMLRSLHLSSHNLTDIPKSNDSSLERRHAYSKVNKEGMKVYDLTADVRESTTPPPPLPVKRIEALIHEEQDFYDDSRGQPESESLVRCIEPAVNALTGHQDHILPQYQQQQQQQDLAEVHQPSARRTPVSSPPRTPRHCSPPREVQQESPSDKRSPPVVAEQPRRSQSASATPTVVVDEEVNDPAARADGSDETDSSSKIMFNLPKLRDASERKITPINEEHDELSIRTEIQKVITKLHKTGGWRKATCTPGEPYLTLDLRKETKTDLELPLSETESPAKEPATLSVAEPSPPSDDLNKVTEQQQPPPPSSSVKDEEPPAVAAAVDEPKLYSQIDMEALDFKKAREALKKFTNDGTNPLLKQLPNRSIPLLADDTRAMPGDVPTLPLKARLMKTVSAPPNLKTAASTLPSTLVGGTSDQLIGKLQQSPAESVRGEPATVQPGGESVRDEDDDRINFKAARETLQKLTSLNNGMFFMTDRKHRQAF